MVKLMQFQTVRWCGVISILGEYDALLPTSVKMAVRPLLGCSTMYPRRSWPTFQRSLLLHLPDDGGSKCLWNVIQYLSDYMVLHPRKYPFSCQYRSHLSLLLAITKSLVSDYRLNDQVCSLAEAEDFFSTLCIQTSSWVPPPQPPLQWALGSYSGDKVRPRHDVDQSPPSTAKVKNEKELYLLSPSAPAWHVMTALLCFTIYSTEILLQCTVEPLGAYSSGNVWCIILSMLKDKALRLKFGFIFIIITNYL
jgi:hypothetical protein